MTTSNFTPKLVDQEKTVSLRIGSYCDWDVFSKWLVPLMTQGWRFYVVQQSRGRCYWREKVITIPVFALARGKDYSTWYIAHEMAHAYDECRSNHGPSFMQWLIKICPQRVIHNEASYKPRNLFAAGAKIDADNCGF